MGALITRGGTRSAGVPWRGGPCWLYPRIVDSGRVKPQCSKVDQSAVWRLLDLEQPGIGLGQRTADSQLNVTGSAHGGSLLAGILPLDSNPAREFETARMQGQNC